MPRPRVKFAVRYPAGDGKFWYQPVWIQSPDGSVYSRLEHLPVIGDLISLWDSELLRRNLPQPEGGPRFRVIAREWMHASWGSVTWPYGADEPKEGPMVDIIVEPAGHGAYGDETDICAESTCEAKWVNGQWWFPPGSDTPDPHEHHPYVPLEKP